MSSIVTQCSVDVDVYCSECGAELKTETIRKKNIHGEYYDCIEVPVCPDCKKYYEEEAAKEADA